MTLCTCYIHALITVQVQPAYLEKNLTLTFTRTRTRTRTYCWPHCLIAKKNILHFIVLQDFGDTIPGHGGLVDRFDCQLLMATFVHVYHSSFIK